MELLSVGWLVSCGGRTDSFVRGRRPALFHKSFLRNRRCLRFQHAWSECATRFGSTFGCCFFGAALAAFILSGPPSACAVVVTDDFSDGTDGSAGTPTNPTASPPNVSGPVWSRYDAEVFSFGQGWDASTGQYRLTAPCNGAFASAGGQYGFAGSFVNQNFNDFSMSVDVVKPTGNPTYVPTGYLFGILAAHERQQPERFRRQRWAHRISVWLQSERRAGNTKN